MPTLHTLTIPADAITDVLAAPGHAQPYSRGPGQCRGTSAEERNDHETTYTWGHHPRGPSR